MRLSNVKYDRNMFFNYRGDFDFEVEIPILEPESNIADFRIDNLKEYPYIYAENATAAFNDAILEIAPYSFFSHVHLCRILYESVEITHDGADYIFHFSNNANENLPTKIEEIIQIAGRSQLFEKKILEEYFDLFCISQNL